MKVLHVPYCFRPDAVGGTEVYVEALAREQQRRGTDVVVAAPASSSAAYVLDDLPVRRFATLAHPDLDVLYGGGDQEASHAFTHVLDAEQPDVVHLHAFTSAVSRRVADEVRRRDIALVFTYHTPTVSCQRGTLMRWGREVCDGTLDVHRCAACGLHGRGAPLPASLALGALPTSVGAAFGSLGVEGNAWTGLRMTELVRRQHAALRELLDLVDRVVVLSTWAGEVLKRNGVPEHKLVLSRHGLPSPAPIASDRKTGGLRIAFLGRLDPTKGADVLLRAVRALPEAPLEVHVFGISQSASAARYEQSLRDIAGDDRRISFRPPVKSSLVTGLLSGYDVLAVPSRWLETGPLVVLEAFAAGVPVLGSRLGGVAELVQHGIDGLLVDSNDDGAWAAALGRLWREPGLLEQLRAGVRPPRGMSAVAADMRAVYDAALHLAPV